MWDTTWARSSGVSCASSAFVVDEFQVLAADLGGLYVLGLNVSELSGIGCGRSGVYGSLLGISTWIVSVLPPRLRRGLCEDSFMCRRRE